MGVVGIVSEYNPFHRGHAWHLAAALEKSGCAGAVCAMSGSFTQRGQPTLLPKWLRARMAISGGAALVVELPCAFAARSAEGFAQGGVALLAALPEVTHLAFGCEWDDLAALRAVARLIDDAPPTYQARLREGLQAGLGYAAARQQAVSGALGLGPDERAALKAPNTILAVEYLRALGRLGDPLTPVLIPRRGAGYHDPNLTAMASATAIRRFIAQGEWEPALNALPGPSAAILERARADGWTPADPERYGLIALNALRRMGAQGVAALPDVSEGLQRRIEKAARQSGSLAQCIELASTRRYPAARIARVALCAALGYTGDMAALFQAAGPAYARVLAFAPSARDLLAQSGRLPWVVKAAHYRPTGAAAAMWRLEQTATDLFALCLPDPERRAAGLDFTWPVRPG
ncbi:MAG: nucleotidyltransferase family protein [Christensenellales bacterium]|jgi:predicted nucleotidyltransferase